MSRMHARWPVISFLDLFCCAVGGAIIMLLVVSREIQSQCLSTKTLRVMVEVQLSGSGQPIVTFARGAGRHSEQLVLPSTESERYGAKLWGESYVDSRARNGALFLACDAAGRPDRYKLRIAQRDIQQGVSSVGDESLPNRLRELNTQTRRFTPNAILLYDLSEALLSSLLHFPTDSNVPEMRGGWKEHWTKVFGVGHPQPTGRRAADYATFVEHWVTQWQHPPSNGPDARQLALLYVLLQMKDVGADGSVVLKTAALTPFCQRGALDRTGQLESLWSDLKYYLSLKLHARVPHFTIIHESDRTQLDLGYFANANHKFGMFYYRGDRIVPQRSSVSALAISTPAEVDNVLRTVDSSKAFELGPLWIAIATALCEPRHLSITIDWGSQRYRPITLDRLHGKLGSDGAQMYYDLDLLVKPDEVLVDGQPLELESAPDIIAL